MTFEEICTAVENLYNAEYAPEDFGEQYDAVEAKIRAYNVEHGTRYYQSIGGIFDRDAEEREENELAKKWDAHMNGEYDRWTLEQDLGGYQWVHDCVVTLDLATGFAC